MVLLQEIDEQRSKAGRPPVSGVLRRIFETLDEADILGPLAIGIHERAINYGGDASQDERRSQACTDFLVRKLVPEALLAFDGEWLTADAEQCQKLKGPQLGEHIGALDEKVRQLAGVARFRADLERGYTNAQAAAARLSRSVWGGVTATLLSGTRGSHFELLSVPSAEIVRLLVSGRAYELVDAEDVAASSENVLVPWASPPLPQLQSASGRFAPFAEAEERLLQRLAELIAADLMT